MGRTDPMATGALPARRWLTLLALLTASIAATLALTAVLSSPADAAPPEGKGGGGDNSLADRLDALEEKVGLLEAANAAQDAKVATLETANAAQDAKIATLETANAAITDLQALLKGVTRADVFGDDTLTFSDMNVRVVNGQGMTDTKNGLGNLIIGYNRVVTSPNDKTGSHYLIVGDDHNYSSWGGIVAGFDNTASGPWASVSGGIGNTASGPYASVSGGARNLASSISASVSGGYENVATSRQASVSGGELNTASGLRSLVSGGLENTAAGPHASVSGGFRNKAGGETSSVTAGRNNIATGGESSVTGGYYNVAHFTGATVVGGNNVDCLVALAVCGEGELTAAD